MPAKPLPIDADDLVRLYLDGESLKSLAKTFGVSRQVVMRWLNEAGVTTRGRSDAMYVRMAKATTQERKSLAMAANAAVRGSVRSETHRENLAASRERRGVGRRSPGEVQLGEMLRAQGYDVIHEKAVGKYNVDIATGSVAVEVLGGGWHGVKPHGERLRYLLDRGWDVIYIWVDPINFPLGPEAAEYVVTHAKVREGDPASPRCYRVIRGTGQFIAGGGADRDDVPDILPYTDRPYLGPVEVPFGFCHCGCGRETARYATSNRNKGILAGDPHLYISGHNRACNPR